MGPLFISSIISMGCVVTVLFACQVQCCRIIFDRVIPRVPYSHHYTRSLPRTNTPDRRLAFHRDYPDAFNLLNFKESISLGADDTVPNIELLSVNQKYSMERWFT